MESKSYYVCPFCHRIELKAGGCKPFCWIVRLKLYQEMNRITMESLSKLFKWKDANNI